MTAQAPIPDYLAARQAMVDSQLRPQGVNDPAVVAAMAAVPREQFVPEEQRPLAYADRSIPLGEGREMPAPAVTGLLLTALAPLRGETALVVGAGSGYSAAVLAAMGVTVTALESSPALADVARAQGLDVVEGPLASGYAGAAPYDLVLIDGAVELIPDSIVDQLAEGGRLGAGLAGEGGIVRLVVGRKAGGGFATHSVADAATPRLPGFERPAAFAF